MSTESPKTDSAPSPNYFKLCTEKLTELNFANWRYDMKCALGIMNLDPYIIEHTAALKAHPDYTSRVKLAENFIRLHLSREESTRFIDDLDTYDPKTLWESIISHYASKTVENTANLMDRLHDYTFDEADMQASINTFRSLFKEMLELLLCLPYSSILVLEGKQ
ncbi:hypothetical protein MJO29_001172 [Puccinia striiformis f. sp. tritici]|nr:hypothetical protein MJO29_015184 [Puccinia striiformis f. sp. tritici]KAI7960608.1 hypothetical protein MJO29_005676 [Puccinia striiformis f. sp. tritici]KAI7967894.1 hypothetical protein MJO29_001171 [Puccinia striiformis f. sp. tritici]KAI7967895.1 hypothetical protein MJO29_001172 [Puccinia striiformis f. sp. tritici]